MSSVSPSARVDAATTASGGFETRINELFKRMKIDVEFNP
jgi:hypothetical protein